MKTLTLLTNSIFLLLCLIAIGSCNSIEDMNQAFETQAAGVLEEPPLPDDKYTPGVYPLKALIPDEIYNLHQNRTGCIVGKSGLKNFQWYLETSAGASLGCSWTDSDGVRHDEGGVVATGTKLYIYSAVTETLTSKNIDGKTKDIPHILRCHAFNEDGDEYYDAASIFVVEAPNEDEDGDD